jgi:hypothetical protein
MRGAFSTALPYDLGSERVVLLLVPVATNAGRSAGGVGHRASGGAMAELRAIAANGLEFQLRTARSLGRSQPMATVTVGGSLSADQTEALRFNPWTTGPGIRPSGWLNLLRDAAYRASQRGRSRATRPVQLRLIPRFHRRTCQQRGAWQPANAPPPVTWLTISPRVLPATPSAVIG